MKITDLRDNEIYLLRKDVEQDKNLSYIWMVDNQTIWKPNTFVELVLVRLG
jgi:hypothetical protein